MKSIPESIVTADRIDRERMPDCLACRRSVTRLSQRLLPNVVLKFYQIRFFFTKHVQIPRFEISGCVPAWAACSNCSHVFTCYTLFGLFHGDSITKPSNNHVNIISNTFLDMKASNINDIQGLKFIFFLGIHATGIPGFKV